MFDTNLDSPNVGLIAISPPKISLIFLMRTWYSLILIKERREDALEVWIQIRGQLPSRLEYFPDDFDQSLTYMELPYYRYEFERKKRRLETKRRSDGWLNDIVGYGTICHDSRGNLVDGLGNPIREEVVEKEEEEHDRDEELRLRLKQEQAEKWHSDYIQLMEHMKNPKYISHCADTEAQRIF